MFAREGKATQKDLISDVVGSPRFLQPWYPDELTVAVLGPLVKEPIRISRFYFDPDVRVAVDFEPDPRDERFYVDEKRQWCTAQKIVYVPFFLADQLTMDQFSERLQEARVALTHDRRDTRDRKVLDAAEPGVALLEDPEVALWIDREAVRLVEEGIQAGNHWYGYARNTKLAKLKRGLVKKIMETYPRGSVGPEYRAHVAPHPAGG